MTFQSAPQAAQVKCLFRLNGEKVSSFSLYAKQASINWNEVDLALLATSVSDAIKSDYVPVLSTSHAFVGVIAKDLEAEFPLFVEDMEPADVPGTLASPALPNSNALVVTWLGAAGSAPRSGRIYLPSPTEGQVTGSSLTGAAQTALNAAATALRASVEDPAGLASVSQAVLSRFSGSTIVGTTSTGKVVKEATRRAVAVVNGVRGLRVGARLDSQRKRMPREAA